MATLPRLKSHSRPDEHAETAASVPLARASRPDAPPNIADLVDLDAERALLSDLIAADDPDPTHPLFTRYQRYLERVDALKRERGLYALRQEADPAVPLAEASKLPRMGQLSSDGGDRMRLHTREAMRLFLGRSVKPGEAGYSMAGGKRVAAALRALWSLSANDNPYADWALIEATDRVVDLRQKIEAEQGAIMATLEAMKAKGLDYAILQSREPAELTLGFASPYGYMVALLLVEFDFLVRVVKSAVLRDLIGSISGREEIRRFKHQCLSVFHFAVRWQIVLTRPELVTLSRIDFLPNARDEAKCRVQDVRTSLGMVPREILVGEKQPRHSKRRLPQLSAADLQLLNDVPLAETGDASLPLLD
ncbi:PFL_4669 family integrating conjugative element protein [Trinickia symbiotica]|uniref:PFL_4669 family integrating conjugative element protein n=1 Tax=Trinickia symbiotica TaxID=863227 RepID=UPI0003A5BB33|nr:TIGR03761 family integrating conjugative element protein [Trinickia symbiotica]